MAADAIVGRHRRLGLLLSCPPAHPDDPKRLHGVVALVGGTNVGKTFLARLLTASPLLCPNELAAATKQAVLATPHPLPAGTTFLPGYALRELTDARQPEAAPAAQPALWTLVCPALPFALLDTPDIDSALKTHRTVTERLLAAVDAVVLVTTPEKYADAAGLDFLAEAQELGRATLVVFNKAAPEAQAAGRDLARLLRERLSDDPVLVDLARGATSAEPVARAISPLLAGGRATRRAAARAVEVIATDVRAILDAQAPLLVDLESLLTQVRARAQGRVNACLAAFDRLPSPELEGLFREVQRRLPPTGLDLVLGGLESSLKALGRGLGRLSGPRKEARERYRQARERLREAFAVYLRGARLDLHAALRAEGRVWPPERLESGLGNDDDHEAVAAHLDLRERERERFARTAAEELARDLARHPNRLRVLRELKSVIQLGAVAAVVFTVPGTGVLEWMAAGAAGRATSWLFEQALDRPTIARLGRRLWTEERAGALALLESRLLEPFRQRALEQLAPAEEIRAALEALTAWKATWPTEAEP